MALGGVWLELTFIDLWLMSEIIIMQWVLTIGWSFEVEWDRVDIRGIWCGKGGFRNIEGV